MKAGSKRADEGGSDLMGMQAFVLGWNLSMNHELTITVPSWNFQLCIIID